MKQIEKIKEDIRPEKKVRKFGYEYTLVECNRDTYRSTGALGVTGYVIKSCRKLTEKERQ
jgi:hypothetical protein